MQNAYAYATFDDASDTGMCCLRVVRLARQRVPDVVVGLSVTVLLFIFVIIIFTIIVVTLLFESVFGQAPRLPRDESGESRRDVTPARSA